MAEVLLNSFVLCVFGAVCAMIASSRGRSPVGWFVVGLVAPCLGIILLLVLPDLTVERSRDRRLETENRLLREQVRKDRIVADRRYAETSRRLETHDQALGLDTSERIDPLAGSAAAATLAADAGPERGPDEGRTDATPSERTPDPTPPATPFDATSWYYAEGSARSRLTPFGELRELWMERKVGAFTLVWTEGMADWKRIAEVEGLEDSLRA